MMSQETPPLLAGFQDGEVAPRVHDYLADVVTLAGRHFGEQNIVSGILFGSHAKRQTSAVSDCDTLIVVDDSVRRRQIRRARPDFYALEIKYRFNDKKEKLIGGILRSVEATTGMFKSFFIAKRRDLEKKDFARMFSLNYLFARLLAPDKLVLGSLGCSAKTFYGEDLLHELRSVKPTTIQFLKNFFTTVLISLSSSLIMPVTPKRDARYHLEAVKWALNGSYYYLFNGSPTLDTILSRYERLGIVKRKFAALFRKLRQNPRMTPKFALRGLYYILRIHAKSLQLKKRVQ
ncbi:MAG: hypothetical protein ACTSU5_14480 [Promethearchaeota archaeon]